jgi:hypothetical protein
MRKLKGKIAIEKAKVVTGELLDFFREMEAEYKKMQERYPGQKIMIDVAFIPESEIRGVKRPQFDMFFPINYPEETENIN